MGFQELDVRTDRRPLKLREMFGWIPLAWWLARRGVTPNAVSLAGLVAGAAAGLLLAGNSYCINDSAIRVLWVAAALAIALRGACNILDGVIAVETGQASPVGLLWNEVPDRLTDAATLIGAGYALGGEPVLGWCAALIATLVSYARIQCRLAGAPMDFSGPMAKPMRMIVIVVTALWLAVTPDGWHPHIAGHGAMTIALWIVIAGGAITFVRRLRNAARVLRAAASA